MRIRQIVFAALLLLGGILLGGILSQTFTVAPAPALVSGPGLNTAEALALTSIEVIKGRLDQIERRLDRWALAAAIVPVVLAFAGFFGYTTLRRWAKSGVESALNSLAKTEVDAQLPLVMNSALEKAEKQILRLAKLLALRANKSFDEALEEFGWSGRVTEIRAESPIFRRALIDCLYNAKTNQKKNREDAWTAVNELLADDPTLDTIRLALKICVSGRRFDEGSTLLAKHRSTIEADKDAALYAATLLRRQGLIKDALTLAERFKEAGDFQSIVTISALKRELGLFAEAHDTLFPAVQRVISYTGDYQQPASFRVLNTYIANCLDRNRPQDAVRSAYYILRSSSYGGVELFTVGRLIQRLPEHDPERAELLDTFRHAIPKLMENEARFKCEVTLAEIEGRLPDAISALLRVLAEVEQGQDAKRMRMDAYFYRSHLAQIYLRQGDTRQAIDIVISATQAEYGGEAKYYLAAAYAVEGRGDDAVRWLKEAMNESPRWAVYARDDDRFRRELRVAKLLAEQPQTPA